MTRGASAPDPRTFAGLISKLVRTNQARPGKPISAPADYYLKPHFLSRGLVLNGEAFSLLHR